MLIILGGCLIYYFLIGFDLTRLPINFTGRAIMQFDRNQAFMRGDRVVVLQPDKEPVQFHYDNTTGKLTIEDLDQDLARTAIAHPLWGTMAYNKLLYSPVDRSKPDPK